MADPLWRHISANEIFGGSGLRVVLTAKGRLSFAHRGLPADDLTYLCVRLTEPSECLAPSDHGIAGAVPLSPDTWNPLDTHARTDAEWAEQNRKINALLAGRNYND